MKLIGQNKSVFLTKQKAEYWVSHQANQRSPIERHVKALAKMLARVGWRNDQRICITEDNKIINGLQRLSAIILLGDYGWNIPVTVFKNEEITNDVISSFNIQKQDSNVRLMRRLYGWTDKRITSICNNIWATIERHANPTPNDLLCIYEGLKPHIDKVLTIKDAKSKGSNCVPTTVLTAASLCSLAGMNIDSFIEAGNEYSNDNKSGAIWKALKEWDIRWKKMTDSSGKYLTTEPGQHSLRVARRFLAVKCLVENRKILILSSIPDKVLNDTADYIRSIVRSNI